MTRGVKTSEFWVMIFGHVFGLLTMSGLITPEQASEATRAVGTIAGGVIAIMPIIVYIWGRSKVKISNGGK